MGLDAAWFRLSARSAGSDQSVLRRTPGAIAYPAARQEHRYAADLTRPERHSAGMVAEQLPPFLGPVAKRNAKAEIPAREALLRRPFPLSPGNRDDEPRPAPTLHEFPGQVQ